MGDMSREPSMEEILSSIRQVIARDDGLREEVLAARCDAVEDEPDVEADEESIAPTVRRPRPQAKAAVTDSLAEAVADDALLSADSAVASRHALDALAVAVAETPVAPAAAPAGDQSINALVEAMLRPMLRDWLDSNLPPIVEKLVAKEISRITGGRG